MAAPGLCCGMCDLLVAACRLLVAACMWDLVPWPRDWTQAPCIGSMESYPLDLQGSPDRPVFWLRCSVEVSGCDGIWRGLKDLTGFASVVKNRRARSRTWRQPDVTANLSTVSWLVWLQWKSFPRRGERRDPRGWHGARLSSQSHLQEPHAFCPDGDTGILAVWVGTVQGHFEFHPN